MLGASEHTVVILSTLGVQCSPHLWHRAGVPIAGKSLQPLWMEEVLQF